jgi:hypothetical protein
MRQISKVKDYSSRDIIEIDSSRGVSWIEKKSVSIEETRDETTRNRYTIT